MNTLQFSASAILLCSLLQLGTAHAQTTADRQQTLQVQQVEGGSWVGWVIDRNRRTPITVPQTRDEIQRFADGYGIKVDWQKEPPAVANDLPVTSPPVVQTAGQTPAPPERPPESIPVKLATSAPKLNGDAAPSVAENTTRLERTILADTERLETFRAELANPKGEYQQAELEFKTAESELADAKAKVAELNQANKPDDLKAAEEALKGIQTKHDLSRQRFDLAIQTRKTVQEQMTALEEKIRQDRLARDKLTGAVPAAAPESPPPAPPTGDPGQPGTPPPAAPVAPPAATVATTPAPTPASADPQPSAAQTGKDAAAAAPLPQEPVRAELLEAQQHAELKKEEVRVAELEAQSITDRIQTLDKTIGLEQKLFEAARKKADIAYQQQHAIQSEYQDKADAGAPRAELQPLAQKRRDTVKLFEKARAEVAERTDRLDQLQSERTALQAEELAALKSAEEKRDEAALAEEQVGTLKNPFSMHNMLQWLLDHGLKITLILVGILFLRMLLKLTTRRFVDLMVKSGARGTQEERADRATTLVGVFQNAGSLAIIVSGILMICDEVGIAVGPLMGGAAVVGLAFAFGAQNLIRDYFYGFVILLENQYKINDVLKIGDISGQVERITLRMTVLRDLEGRVHFIPNGKIDSVTNMTHGWSRAVFEIGVAYKEDADYVMTVLMDLARGLRHDPKMAPLILDDPEMLGVDALGDSAVVLKFVIKTRPMKQWAVKRELLRQIKRRFDELGIEIPFPHRTVYHHHDTAAESRTESPGNDYQNRRAA